MTDEPIELSKERIEREKLLLEIAKLRRPWWQEPAYISALLPTTIALISVLIAWQSGLLDAKSLNLETRRIKLERDVHEFEARNTNLWRLNAQLSQQSAALRATNTTLDADRRNLNRDVAAIVRSRDLISVERDQLNAQNLDLRKEQSALRSRVAIERRTAIFAPLNDLLRDVQTVSVPLRLPASGFSVITRMRSDGALATAYRSDAERFLANTSNHKARALVLVAMALGTGDETMADRLIQEVEQSSQTDATLFEALEDYYIREAISVGWNEQVRLRMLPVIARWLEIPEASPSTRDQLIGLTLRLVVSPSLPVYKRDSVLTVRLVRSAMRAAVGDRSAESYRWHAFFLLSQCSPPAFIVAASVLFTDENEKDLRLVTDVEGLLQSLRYAAAGVDVQLGQPRSRDSSLWKAWQVNHSNVINLWSGDLKVLEENPAKLVAATEGRT